jgi:voltage-gated potassium channel
VTDNRWTLRDRFRHVVQATDTPLGRAFDISIHILVIVSLISFSIDTLPNLTPVQRMMLSYVEWLTVILFSIEYVLRVWVAKRSWDYVFSFYGLVDLFAVLPFYIFTSLDLTSLKILRLLQLLRILKLGRFSSAISRFQKALEMAREEILLFLLTTMMLLYLSSVGIYYFEHEAQPDVFSSIFHSLWWAVATLTTVGYGDVYPITVGGKIFTFLILIVGLGIVGIPAGLIASSLSAVRRNEGANEHEPE